MRPGVVRPRFRGVAVEARAKLNLGLAVGPRRADGFHEIVTIFQSISLADTVIVRPRRAGFSLTLSSERAAVRGAPVGPRLVIPKGRDNLVLRAARLLASHARIGGASFTVIKRIPVQAGLGGGSADAAAALVGLARLYGVRLPLGVASEMAAVLGSDVPFALRGGTALGRGRGERIEPLTLARPFRALLVVPRWTVSTASAYRAIDRRRNHLTAWRSNLRFAKVLGRERLSPEHAMRLGNSFESALGSRRRDFETLRRRLEDAGAACVRMTGSGSAVAGLLPSGRAGTAAVRRYQGQDALYLVRSVGRGLKVTTRS